MVDKNQELKTFLFVAEVVPEGGTERATASRREILGLPVGEKLRTCRGISTDEHIYISYKRWELVIDLAKKNNRLLSSCQI